MAQSLKQDLAISILSKGTKVPCAPEQKKQELVWTAIPGIRLT